MNISASLTGMSSASLIDNISVLLLTKGMKTIEEIRLARLDMLVSEYGSITELAQKLKMSHSQVSQWVNRSIDHKSGKPRTMNSATARRVESLTEKPTGWMDQHIYSEDFDRIFSLIMGVGDKKQVQKIESIIRTLVDEDHPKTEKEPHADDQKTNEKSLKETDKRSNNTGQQVSQERRKSEERRNPDNAVAQNKELTQKERREVQRRRNNGNSSTEYPRWFKHH